MNKDVRVNAWIEAQFSSFDEFLKQCAVDSELEFQGRAGTVRGRSLRRETGRLRVAIDLFMTNSFMEIYERPDDNGRTFCRTHVGGVVVQRYKRRQKVFLVSF